MLVKTEGEKKQENKKARKQEAKNMGEGLGLGLGLKFLQVDRLTGTLSYVPYRRDAYVHTELRTRRDHIQHVFAT